MPDNNTKVFAIGFLVVVWWVGIWGIIELAVNYFAKGSSVKELFAYATMVLFVVVMLYIKPVSLEHFF
jgi:hypothetical protein